MEYLKHLLNKNIITEFKHEKKSNMLMESYLISSPDSLTNKQLVTALCLTLLCENDACLKCPDCIKILEQTHPDVLSFPEGKSFAVSDAEKIIIEATKKPMLLDKKIIVINDIDNSSNEAQNKILKIVETPPKGVIFIATCTNLESVLSTIKSRMQQRVLEPFSDKELEEIFIEYKNNDNYEMAICNGGGYLGQTLNILQNSSYTEVFNLAKNLVFAVKTSGNLLNYTSKSKLNKDSATLCLDIMSKMYRDIMLINLGCEKLIENKFLNSQYKQVAGEFSVNALLKIQDLIINYKKKVLSNVNITMAIETLLFKILEVKYLCK